MRRLREFLTFRLHPLTQHTSLLPLHNSVIIPAPALQAVPWGNVANYMHLWGELRKVMRARGVQEALARLVGTHLSYSGWHSWPERGGAKERTF